MSPDPSDVLLALAEVAAAFVGFSSVVAIFQRRGGAASFDVFRFWILLEFALAALAFSLLPFVLHFLGLSEGAVWAVAGAGMSAFVLGHLVVVRPARRLPGVARSLTPLLSVSGVLVQLAVLVAGLANLVLRDFGVYLGALSLLFLASAVNFVRLVKVGMPSLRS